LRHLDAWICLFLGLGIDVKASFEYEDVFEWKRVFYGDG